MAALHRMSVGVLASLLVASPALAQRTAPQASSPDDWRHGTTVAAAVGVATDQSDTGGLAGGALGWELTPRVMVEGSGLWLDRPGGSHGFNAALKVRAGLTHTGVSPFVEGGVGLYRLTTDASGELPEFYRRRMASQGASLSQRSFTDPVFHIGAGVNVFTSRHVSVQPAVEALLVRRDSHSYSLTAVSVRVAYHFEDHPVTR